MYTVYDMSRVGAMLYKGDDEVEARRALYATRPGGRHSLYVNDTFLVSYSQCRCS